MPLVSWFLTRAATGETRSLADWGIKSAKLTRINQGIDILDLGFGGQDLLAGSPFQTGETLQLLRTPAGVSAVVFAGRVNGATRGAYGSSEGLSVQVAGPWWHLANLVYQQTATFVSDPTANPAPANGTDLQIADFPTATKTTSDILVSTDVNKQTVDSRAQIIDALNYAIAKGAPISLGTVDPGVTCPRDELQDVSCADVIGRAIRWTPDYVVWFDYSATPPLVNVRSRANRTSWPIDIAAGAIAEIEVNPRPDLAVSGVTINYFRTHQRTNFEFNTLDKDTAAPVGVDPEGIGALVITLELFGSYLVGGGNPNVNGGTQLIAHEPTPNGLAAALFAAYSAAPYDGHISLIADECTADPWTSRVISILNGSPEWAAAQMLVQQSSDDIFSGRTELTIGPPKQLGPQDLLGLVRKGKTQPPTVPDVISGGGGSPSPNTIPTSSTDPKLVFGGSPPQVILEYHYGQDVGFPNGYGGAGWDSADVYDIAGSFIGNVRGADLAPNVVSTIYGVRFGRREHYHPRTETIIQVQWRVVNQPFSAVKI